MLCLSNIKDALLIGHFNTRPLRADAYLPFIFEIDLLKKQHHLTQSASRIASLSATASPGRPLTFPVLPYSLTHNPSGWRTCEPGLQKNAGGS